MNVANRMAPPWYPGHTRIDRWAACESVQRGLSSPHAFPGPLAPDEDAVYAFVTTVARGYLGERVAETPCNDLRSPPGNVSAYTAALVAAGSWWPNGLRSPGWTGRTSGPTVARTTADVALLGSSSIVDV
jgi:hypothetical protein